MDIRHDHHSKFSEHSSLHIVKQIFSLWWQLFKIYSLSDFQIYNTVLLTTVTMLYIPSPGLSHLRPEACTFWPPSPNPSSPAVPLTTTNLFSVSMNFFLFSHKWDHSICLPLSGLFDLAPCPRGHFTSESCYQRHGIRRAKHRMCRAAPHAALRLRPNWSA